MLHSCCELVMSLYLSWDLIGVYKFLCTGPRILSSLKEAQTIHSWIYTLRLTIQVQWFVQTYACTHKLTCNFISSPDPTLEEGKGSGELWPNPWFLCYDAHQQGHITLGSDWSAQLRSYNDVAFLPWASHVTVPELRSDWCVEIPLHRPKDLAQVYQTLFPQGQGLGDETNFY